jgi:hypothetical protein
VRQTAEPGRRWPAPSVATAALVAFTLVVAVLAVGLSRAGKPHPRELHAPAMLATPPAEPTSETLFTTTLLAEMLPNVPGDRTFNAWHAVLDPGARVPIEAQFPGPQITHVVAGELTLRVDGTLQVFRGTGGTSTPEAIPQSTEVVLRPGDTAVYAYDTPAEYTNVGASPVDILGGELAVGAVPGMAVPMAFIDYGEKYPVPALPAGPLQVAIVRAAVPPNGALPAPATGTLAIALGANEDVNLGETSDGSLRNISPREVTVYVFTFTPGHSASGTPTGAAPP